MKFTTDRPYFWLFATLAAVGLIADQASKYVVFAKLYPAEHAWESRAIVIADWFDLRTAYTFKRDAGDEPLSFLRTISGERLPHVNKGALFGVGNEDGEGAGMNSLFLGISLVAAVFIIFWVARPTVARDRWLCLALGMILAGTLGNLYDRVVFSGVRDFLHCYYVAAPDKIHVWPDFNIADCCLVTGATVLLVHSFFAKDPNAEPAKSETTEAAPPLQTTAPTPGA